MTMLGRQVAVDLLSVQPNKINTCVNKIQFGKKGVNFRPDRGANIPDLTICYLAHIRNTCHQVVVLCKSQAASLAQQHTKLL